MSTYTSRPFPRRLFFFLLLLIAGGILAWIYLPRFLPGDAPPETIASDLQVNVADGAILNDPVLTITGNTPADRQVVINGQAVPVDPLGNFELTLRLAEGPNLILIEAVSPDGSRTSLARQVTFVPPGEEPPPPPPTDPLLPTSLLVAAVSALGLAIVIAILRRRRPWVNLTTDAPELLPGAKGEGPAITIIIELDRTTRISLYAHNAGGIRVATMLNNRQRKAGRHTLTWDGYVEGSLVSSGKYTLVAEAGVPPFRTISKTEIQIRPNLRLG